MPSKESLISKKPFKNEDNVHTTIVEHITHTRSWLFMVEASNAKDIFSNGMVFSDLTRFFLKLSKTTFKNQRTCSSATKKLGHLR